MLELHQLEKLELWCHSETLKRRRKLLSVDMMRGLVRGGGSGTRRRENVGAAFNFSRDDATTMTREKRKDYFLKYLVVEQGDFRLYQIPEVVLFEGEDEGVGSTSVTSSIVLGTWMDRQGGGGSGGSGRSGIGMETISFCMLHVHLHHAVQRLLSPLPRSMSLVQRPISDDFSRDHGERGYMIVLSLRSFARCCWETQASQLDLTRTRSNCHGSSSTTTSSSAILRGRLVDGKNIAWDSSLHFCLEPSLLCRTPCFSTEVKGACVLECTMYDEFHNVILGNIDVVRIQPLDGLLASSSSSSSSSTVNERERASFWNQVRSSSSFGATIDLESRCGVEIQSPVGLIQIAMCRVLADQNEESILAVEKLEIVIDETWRRRWFGL